MAKIKVLPFELANQIAAGEVVERPASIVKELLENSLDANATSISVEIEQGGISKIKIIDNGDGIAKDDLPLAICAHATSKISKVEDLHNIVSMGFRGEALASIASVSKINIISRVNESDLGYELDNTNPQNGIKIASRTTGTTICVKDLFYNVPVRKKFLKSVNTEYMVIENILRRFAMSEPKVALSFKNNSKLVFKLPACATSKDIELRLQKIQGKAFIDNAIYLKNTYENIIIEGYISNPDYQRSQNDKIWFYINKRMVKDKLLVGALIKAYDNLLFPGRYPSCVLYISMPTQDVDINVHPQKNEVRFQEPRMVHDLISMSVKGALNDLKPTNKDNHVDSYKEQPEPWDLVSSLQKEDTINESLIKSKEVLLGTPQHEIFYTHGKIKQDESEKLMHTSTAEVKTDYFDENFNDYKNLNYVAPIQTWTILNKRFAVILLDRQSWLIDVVEFLCEQFKEQYKASIKPLASRSLLVPIRCEIDAQLQNKIEKCSSWFEFLGFEINVIGKSHVAIRKINLQLQGIDFNHFFEMFKKTHITSRDDLMKLLLKSFELNLFVLEQRELEAIFNNVYKALEKSKDNDFSISLNVDLCCNLLRFQKSHV